MSNDSPEAHTAMPSTHWSLIGRIQEQNSATRNHALGELLPHYLPALRAHLIWNRRLDHHFAEDVLQNFVTNKVLERDLISKAHQRLGKFRTLLLSSLDHFMIDELRKRRADQRAGGAALDVNVVEQDLNLSGQRISNVFDLAWSQRVLVETLERMRSECQDSGHERIWEIFENRVVAPALDPQAKPIPYDRLLERFGLDSPQQAANVLANAKRRFRRHLEASIARYAAPGEVADEIEHLRQIAATTGGQRLDMKQLMRPATRNSAAQESDFDMLDPQRFPDAFPEEPFGSPWLESELAPILRDVLAMPVAELVPEIAADQLPAPQMTLQDVLNHSSPPLEVLRKLKEYARHHAREPVQSTMPPQVAAIVYSASIAVALERHGTRITKSADDVLNLSFRMVAGAQWTPVEIRQLMHRCLRLFHPPTSLDDVS